MRILTITQAAKENNIAFKATAMQAEQFQKLFLGMGKTFMSGRTEPVVMKEGMYIFVTQDKLSWSPLKESAKKIWSLLEEIQLKDDYSHLPFPERDAPQLGVQYYVPGYYRDNGSAEDCTLAFTWENSIEDRGRLERGSVYLNREKAYERYLIDTHHY